MGIHTDGKGKGWKLRSFGKVCTQAKGGVTCDLSEGLQQGPSFFWGGWGGGGGQWLEAADLREGYGIRTCDPRRATGWGLPTLGKGMS